MIGLFRVVSESFPQRRMPTRSAKAESIPRVATKPYPYPRSRRK
jgi:IMP cyclohydrolase